MDSAAKMTTPTVFGVAEDRTIALWTTMAAVGCALGAAWALILIPGAAFGRSPMGPYGPDRVGFSLMPGLGFGVAQVLALRVLFGERIARDHVLPVAWTAVSLFAMAAMVLPLWLWTAGDLVALPLPAFVPMAPGLLLLGIGQWLLLRKVLPISAFWAVWTFVGGAFGVPAGLAAAVVWHPISVDFAWALIVGGCIALPQSFLLAFVRPEPSTTE